MEESKKVTSHFKLSSMESNRKQREEFIDYWVEFIRSHADEEWSRQQNVLINSMLKSAKQFSREEYLKLKEDV